MQRLACASRGLQRHFRKPAALSKSRRVSEGESEEPLNDTDLYRPHRG